MIKMNCWGEKGDWCRRKTEKRSKQGISTVDR